MRRREEEEVEGRRREEEGRRWAWELGGGTSLLKDVV